VGSDIHSELYYAKLNTIQVWDYDLLRTDNASFVIWFIAPMLSKLLMLDMVWIFKAVLPIFLAFVPVVLFLVFKRQFGDMRAFFAVIFFMVIPAFSMEMASIAKTMVAELFFALMVWVVVNDWKWQYKILGICLTLLMQVVCHYTVAVMGICFLVGMFGIRIVVSPFKWSLFTNSKVPLLVILSCFILGIVAFGAYHGLTSQGHIVNRILPILSAFSPNGHSAGINVIGIPVSSMAKLAIGLDFMSVSIEGKIFRIVQFLTQIMIIIGIVRLAFFNRFNVTAEFVGFIGASGILLAACIFLTTFANMINMSRFYHFALFFISPMFVLGCEAVANIGRKHHE